jgi:subtilisin family serine protease
MATYVVLRDLTPATSSPFERSLGIQYSFAQAQAPSEPDVTVEEISSREILALSVEPGFRAIARVMPTQLVRPVDAAASGSGPAAWGVTAVGADKSSRTGTGVTVAVLDTGIDADHPAFAGVQIVEQDFAGSGNGDRQGHGTHCAGTIAGRAVNGTRIGIATGVTKLLVGKVLADDGTGDSDMLFRGIQWAIQQGAHVISMSLGFDFPGLVKRLNDGGWPVDLATSVGLEAYRSNLRMFDSLMEMIRSRRAFEPGTIVVAAAGNESRRNIDPKYEIGASLPAAAEDVVSVGALEQSGTGLGIAYFSNTFPQIAAPGVDILSAKAGGGLVGLSGTSMATPHVAGVAALWWEEVFASPLPPTSQTVLARLIANATTQGLAPAVDVADRGVGLVRAPG